MALSTRAYTVIVDTVNEEAVSLSSLERYTGYIRRDEIPEAIELINKLIMKNERIIKELEDSEQDYNEYLGRNASLSEFKKILKNLQHKQVA